MTGVELLAVVVSVVVSAAVIPLVVRLAVRLDLLDIPNERSSHLKPVPRGGGIGVIAGTLAGCFLLFCVDGLPALSLSLVAGSAVLVGGIGYVDDRRDVSVQTRLLVHFGAAVLAVCVIGLFPDISSFPFRPILLIFVLSIGLVWALNLFNFMDGIDGLALQEAAFIAFSGSLLLRSTGSQWIVALLCLAGACLVALVWNWAPAKIFLGDVGSGFLGFILALIALDSIVNADAELVTWLILWGVFVVDATVTLIRRVLTGQRWYAAHRSHAYQQLVRRFGSHACVTLGALAVNVLWLLPWAVLADGGAVAPLLCLVVALLPLGTLAVAVGAGRSDSAAERA